MAASKREGDAWTPSPSSGRPTSLSLFSCVFSDSPTSGWQLRSPHNTARGRVKARTPSPRFPSFAPLAGHHV